MNRDHQKALDYKVIVSNVDNQAIIVLSNFVLLL